MNAPTSLCLLGLLFVAPFPSLRANPDKKDEELLLAAGVKPDNESLLQYLRSRTLSDEDRKVIEEQVAQLGHRSFKVRERAFQALRNRGVPAMPYLRAALSSKDLEVSRSAERCLAEIDRGTGPEISLAVLRLLQRKPPSALVAVLVGFVPHAEDENVEEAILEALLKVHPTDGRPDPSLTRALTDDLPARRAAAAYVLGRRTDPAIREELRKLLADNSSVVRFRAAQGLLAGKDRSPIAMLPALLGDAPLGIAWQVEEMLTRLAGEDVPAVSLGSGDAEARTKAREEWELWVKKHGDRADLARVADVRRLLGLTLGIEYNTARVWECGPDGKNRWEITGLHGPMEAWVLPGSRVLIADGNNVTERDLKGNILRTFSVGGSGPTGCQRLPNGNTFVSTYETVMEFDRDGKKLYSHNIGGSNAIRKHKNGNIIYATHADIIEMDVAGRRVRSVPIPNDSMWVGIEDIGSDRFVLANSTTGRVIEVDASGKILWEGKVSGACGVTRLPGGNTLVATSGRVVELDRGGKTIWEKKTTGYVRRVHRR